MLVYLWPQTPKYWDSNFNHYGVTFFHFTSIRTIHVNFAERNDVGLEKYDKFFTGPADSTFSLLNYMFQKNSRNNVASLCPQEDTEIEKSWSLANPSYTASMQKSTRWSETFTRQNHANNIIDWVWKVRDHFLWPLKLCYFFFLVRSSSEM